MIITRLVVKNFGRHEQIDFNSNAAVVGLVGPNGSGKSTILDAIEFAITGEARDELASYVRHRTGNASVELTFIKNGMEGRIFRQFGKTPKRELNWDGQSIKTAKDVDARMASIFGADKHAIANAVFINQGTLEKILFSKDSERRDLMVKLVNMSFCSLRQNILDGKIKKLEGTIVDLGPVIDAQMQALEEAKLALAQAEDISSRLPDYSQQIQFCTEHSTAAGLLRQVMQQVANVETEILSVEQLYQQTGCRLIGEAAFITEPMGGIGGYTAAQRRMEQWDQEHRTLVTDLSEFRTVQAELTHYDRVSSDISLKTRSLTAHQARLKELNPEGLTPQQIDAELAVLRPKISQQKDRERYCEELKTILDQIARFQQELAAIPQPKLNWEQLNAAHAEIANLTANSEMIARFLNQRKEMATCTNLSAGSVTCGKCGLTVSNPDDLKPEAIARDSRQLDETRRLIAEKSAQYTRDKNEWEKLEQERRNKQAQVDQAQHRRVDKANQIDAIPVCDVAVDEGRVQILTLIKAQEPDLKSIIETESKEISRLIQSKATFAKAIVNLGRRAEFTDAVAATKQQAVTASETQLKGRRDLFDELTRLHSRLATLADQKKKMMGDKQVHETVLQRPMPIEVAQLSQELGGNIDAVRSELSARQDARSQAIGRTEQARKTAETANRAYQDLLERAAKDVAKKELLNDLRLLRDLMAPDGLPTAVVEYHFRFLAKLTQDALNQLDANFSITLDPENPLTFNFVRLDEPSHEPLPMTKLSGGQRVRLATAFLFAVQQRLVKDVGLLVLDEPSTHVDEKGVESLAEFMTMLAEKLQHTEMQIIVCDHNMTLKPCFSKLLELK